MRVIITGGTGLIGRALASSLARDGHEVIVLSRDPSRHTDLPAGVRAVRWDARSAADWGELADGAGAIVNLAGDNIAAGRWTAERKRRIRQSRIDAGRAVSEAIAAASNKPGVLVQASAVGYYGGQASGPLTEDAPSGDDFLAGVCRDWEASTAGVEAMGVRRVVTRIGVVLDGQGGALPRMLLPFKLFAGGPVGSGAQPFPWIHLDDVVGAMRFLIEDASASGVYNLSGPEPHDNASFSRVIGRVMHRPAFMPAPGFAMRLAFGEMADILLEGAQAVPARLEQAGYRFQQATAEAALREILSQG
ncbi:MAG: TIGR01777 family protein [Caldilineae bacterium]|nr:TIGR01777 family oxidoreductase [Chloroflexota bacterium]MCB9177259.1 TIGR01777 family protein [Caldilineae bacterium]